MDLRGVLSDRLGAVRQRMAAACARAGRRPEDVTLVAVTKTVPPHVAAAITELGVRDLGENRPQELWRKAAVLPTTVRWHLVGHLQRNKVERTLPLVHLIHSVDSLRLLTALEREAERHTCTVAVLLEVNASREAKKHGFSPEEVPALVPEINKLHNVQLCGLMTMAAYDEDAEKARPAFTLVRQLCNRLRADVGPAHPLDQLSMGMSNDFEAAIEEGATLVRLGTVLFEGVEA
jgi:pyridoxal phosphate enzyme (YggS family)